MLQMMAQRVTKMTFLLNLKLKCPTIFVMGMWKETPQNELASFLP